jgi:hypothetical protein
MSTPECYFARIVLAPLARRVAHVVPTTSSHLLSKPAGIARAGEIVFLRSIPRRGWYNGELAPRGESRGVLHFLPSLSFAGGAFLTGLVTCDLPAAPESGLNGTRSITDRAPNLDPTHTTPLPRLASLTFRARLCGGRQQPSDRRWSSSGPRTSSSRRGLSTARGIQSRFRVT